MIKKLSTILVLLLFSVGLAAQSSDGQALIDKLNTLFKNLALKEKTSESETAAGLESLISDAKKARDQKQIDAAFFRRYQRVLIILRLMAMPGKQGVLAPVFEKEFGTFVEDISGARYDLSSASVAINQVTGALTDEIMNLYLYQDNVKARAKLLKEFEKKYGVK
ncbi:MAG TPA: hypothetical protein VMS75_11110 [Terriglobales bacterium]|nr:hypothetical protein [Terriglobales bacterium]